MKFFVGQLLVSTGESVLWKSPLIEDRNIVARLVGDELLVVIDEFDDEECRIDRIRCINVFVAQHALLGWIPGLYVRQGT